MYGKEEARFRADGEDYHNTLISLNNLAEVFRITGGFDYHRALPLYEECLTKYKRVLCADPLSQ